MSCRHRIVRHRFGVVALGWVLGWTIAASASAEAVRWSSAVLQQPDAWFASDEAKRMAANVLAHQCAVGGWNKNVDYSQPLSEAEQAALAEEVKDARGTIDNGATTLEMRFLIRMHGATGEARYRDAVLRGLDWLLDAQYPNGGWPQYYPIRRGYYEHITYNDDAMVNVLRLLRDLAEGTPPYDLLDNGQRATVKAAFDRGIDCIIATQVVVNGRQKVWGQQHDVQSLEPTSARAYEHASLTAMESVPIIRLLMSIEDPSPQVIAAVQGAIRWLNEDAKLTGIDMIDVRTEDGQRDRKVVEDPEAEPIWARYYEIGTNRPIFSGRDGVIRYDMSEVERERRAGYRWYTRRPLSLIRNEYPAWQAKWAPDDNVVVQAASR